jgi:GAF domain-containing protein
LLIDTAPWLHPGWLTSWLVVHAMAIVVTELGRRARTERHETRRVQREQATRALKAIAAKRADFLAHASDVLASSPNYQTTLAAVANLAVPQIADICVIDVVNDSGELVPLAVAHVDPRKEELVRELRRLYPLDPAAPYGPPRVLRTGQSVIYSELPDSAVAKTSIHPSEMRVALALGICSTMAVPLLVAGRRLGVISFATTDSGRRFVASDLQFAEDLARRAAIAIDTAHP